MSRVEAPEITVLRSFDTWSEQINSNRLISNLISVNKETNRQPDNYLFWVENGILIDPESGRPVLDFILPGVEKEVAEKLQAWAGRNEKGLAFWISPALEGVYPCSKVILHRISRTSGGKKVLQNSAVLFDADFDSPELLRQTLFTQEDTEENISNILQWITEKSGQSIELSNNEGDGDEALLRKRALYYAEMFQRGVSRGDIVEEMLRTGFLGRNSISCPGGITSFSDLTVLRASIFLFNEVQGWHYGVCRLCGRHTLVGPCGICRSCQSKFGATK